MKQIPLTQGQFAIIDDEDYEFLIQWKWQAYYNPKVRSYYAVRCVYLGNYKNTTIYMHRLLLGLTDRKIQGDHIDHNTLNNQRYNLRVATHGQNNANKRSSQNGTSKYLGVCWNKGLGKWHASLRKNKKKVYLGNYHSEIEAAKAYDDAAKKIHGEFANINFPL